MRAADARLSAKEACDNLQSMSQDYTEQLEVIEERKAKLTREAKMPVPGMTFDDDVVMVGDVRFDQLSTAEQIRTSALVAMASNPKLPIILIREGGLVNAKNLALITDAAKDRGFQIFIEKFQSEPGDVGLHIEDGNVTHIDGQSVSTAEAPTEKLAKKPKAAELELEGGRA